MSHAAVRGLLIVALMIAAGASTAGQVINETRGQVSYKGKFFKLGEKQERVAKLLGAKPGNVWAYPRGFTVRFDKRNRAESFQFRAPNNSSTRKGIRIGSTEAQVKAAYPVGPSKGGWCGCDNLRFEIKRGRVTAIELTVHRQKPHRPPQKPPQDDRPPRGKPGQKPPTGPGHRPDVRPTRRDHIMVWNKSWSIGARPQWVDAPLSGWPTDRGELIVRIAQTEGVSQCVVRYADGTTRRLDARDHRFATDHVIKTRARDGKPGWRFLFGGKGKVKVQVHWFATPQATRGYLAKQPYASRFAFAPSGRPAPRPKPQPAPKRLEVWDHTWRVGPRMNWVQVPADWPTDHGRVVVRITYTGGVEPGVARFPNGDTSDLKARDKGYPADVVARRTRRGTKPGWQFGFRGRGRVRAQVLWFDSADRGNRWLDRNPYSTFAFAPEPQEPWAIDSRYHVDDRAVLVWDHSWTARSHRRWVPGPRENWPVTRGYLLIRTSAGYGTRSFFWRGGRNGEAHQESIGDVALDVRTLRRGWGRDARRFWFASGGHGPVRVQLFWVPTREVVDGYCREHPIGKLDPFQVGAAAGLAANPFAWLFGGDGFRREAEHETDWRRASFRAPTAGCINVASPRHGARVRRSLVDAGRCQGSEFDGGIWYSGAARSAWTASWFLRPSTLHRIDIATAGSDHDACGYILVEGRGEDGRWHRLGAFYQENINWHALGGGRRAVSRPVVSIPVEPGPVYTAVRLNMTGHGPFRAGGIHAWGVPAHDPIYTEPEALPASAIVCEVPARAGWIDAGCDVIGGTELFFDTDGSWSLGHDGAVWDGCGAEGYPEYHVRSALRDPTPFLRGLPASGYPAGALIARIGPGGAPFQVVPGVPLRASASGRLWLACNDAGWEDNRGALTVSVLGGVVAAAHDHDPGLGVDDGFVDVRFHGGVTSEASGRAIAGADVIIQMEAWPRTVFGGGRTDAKGAFDWPVRVPKGVPVVIRLPEYRVESLPATWDRPGEKRWDGVIR